MHQTINALDLELVHVFTYHIVVLDHNNAMMEIQTVAMAVLGIAYLKKDILVEEALIHAFRFAETED